MPPSPSKPRSSVRRFHESAGRRGEFWAALFLTLKLYRITGRRVKTPVGELDLVAERFGTIVFVEVKSRGFSHQQAEALGAVNRRRIVNAARFWLSRHPERVDSPMRFDVIFLAPFTWPRHIVAAFDATGLVS
jgi:putative endonuclease